MKDLSEQEMEVKRLESRTLEIQAQEINQLRSLRQQALQYATQNKAEKDELLEVAQKYFDFLNGK